MVTALIVLAFFEECGTAFLVDEPGRRVGESAVRVGRSFTPLGIEEHRPAGAEALQHVVRPRAGRDQLGLGGGFEIGRSEEHTSELQSLMRISYAVFCLKKKKRAQHSSQQTT